MLDTKFLSELVAALQLQCAVDITFTTRKNKKANAHYLPRYSNKGKLTGHKVKVFLGDAVDRPLDSIVAHELIHAWQEEKGIDAIHGKKFASMAKIIARKFALREVYIKRIDTP
jgi:predicted SprT family Zn-dependent metalloprotease